MRVRLEIRDPKRGRACSQADGFGPIMGLHVTRKALCHLAHATNTDGGRRAIAPDATQEVAPTSLANISLGP